VAFVTVSSGGTSDVEEGVYAVRLVSISDPKTVTAQRGPKAGQDIQLLDWTFAIVSGSNKDKELVTSTSTASGPKSKMYAFLTALEGGRPPAVGKSFEKTDLIGRMALATVGLDDGGWPRITNLGAIPQDMLGTQFSQATGTPTRGTPNGAPLNLQPAAVPPTGPAQQPDELPF